MNDKYQLRDVDPVAEQVGDDLLGVVHGTVRVPVDQDLLQTLVHETSNLESKIFVLRVMA